MSNPTTIPGARVSPPRTVTEGVTILTSDADLAGDLSIPANASGLVVFAHGSGSSRFSTRNQFVASALQRAGFATLLLDLLTPDEEQRDAVTAEHRFNIGMLGHRLVGVIDWTRHAEATRALPVGIFGASTGAAAALVAASRRRDDVAAVVSRGGRPDLAGAALTRVSAPTLLIVGGEDRDVIALNNQSQDLLAAESSLAIIPGATHLFEEPGALEKVAELAAEWFQRHVAERPQLED
jgi:pimeloyl-ACP methyl ester carboxylesterase